MFSLLQIGLVVWANLTFSAPTTTQQPAISPLIKCDVGVSVQLPPQQQTVSVQLVGGRTFIATIDPRTTTDRLWLRFGDDRVVLLRPIKWDQVERAEIAGSEISGRKLREFVGQLREESPARQ